MGLAMIDYLVSSLGSKNKELLKKEAELFFNHQNYLCKHDKSLKIAKELNIQRSNIKPGVS